jgi:hypothetical protein
MMHEHPAIKECCIISSPDDYRGETVKALATVHEAARSTTSAEDILSWARGKMASYKGRLVRWSSSTVCRAARAIRSTGDFCRMPSGSSDAKPAWLLERRDEVSGEPGCQPLLRPRHIIRGSGDMLVLSPPWITVRKRDRNPAPFVVRLSRSSKHGHAAPPAIRRFVELAIVAA